PDTVELESERIHRRITRRLAPIAVRAAQINGVIRRRAVELVAVGHPPLGEGCRSVEVERRFAHRHGDDPLARRRLRGEPTHVIEHVRYRARTGERGTNEPRARSVEMRVRIVEAGNDRGAVQVPHSRTRTPSLKHGVAGTYRQYATASDCDGFGNRVAGI